MSVKDITLLRNVEVSMTRVIGNDAHALDVLYPHVRNQYIIKRGLIVYCWSRSFHNLEETIFDSSHALPFLIIAYFWETVGINSYAYG